MKTHAIFPIPPSANAMWKHSRKGVFSSSEYTTWTEECSCYSRQQLDKFTGAVEIVIVVLSGNGWRWDRDIDNIIKPTIDMLVKSERIPNDTCGIVRRVTTEFMTLKGKGEPASLFVRITPYVEPDEEFQSGFSQELVRLRSVSSVRLTKYVRPKARTATGSDQQRGIPGTNRRNSKAKKTAKTKT